PPWAAWHIPPAHKGGANGTGNGHSSSQPLSKLVKKGFGFYDFCLNFVIAKNSRYDVKSFERSVGDYFSVLEAQKALSAIRADDAAGYATSILQRAIGEYEKDEVV